MELFDWYGAFCAIRSTSASLLSWNNTLFGALRRVYGREDLDRFRAGFAWTKATSYKATVSNHSHPAAASHRHQATETMQSFADLLGRRRFDVSTSSREINKSHLQGQRKWNVAGDRQIFDMSDLAAELKNDTMLEDDLVTMVDVDYYIEDFSRFRGKPILLYTMQPSRVAGGTKNGNYYFDSPCTVIENIHGGATYTSSIWDFSPDLVIVKGWFGFTQYAVEKVPQPGTNKSRMMVFLAPKVDVLVPYWLFKLYAKVVGINTDRSRTLRRFRSVVKKGDIVVGRFNHTGHFVTSVARIRGPTNHSTNLPSVLWDTLASTRDRSKTFVLGDIERICNAFSSENQWKVHDYALLADALSADIKPSNLVNFQCYGGDGMATFEVAKPVARVVVEPIVNQTDVAAADSLNNEILTVKTRVTDLTNSKALSVEYFEYAKEFMKFVVPDKMKGTGCPIDMDDVKDKQCTPAQKARQEQDGKHVWRKNKCKAFVKKETSDKISPAHNISTMEQCHTLGLSAYMYAFSDQVLKKTHWYAPGKKPAEQVAMVTKYVRTAKKQGLSVIETDFSRFDATRSESLATVEHMVYNRWVSESRSGELRRLLKGETNLKARTPKGVQYNTLNSRPSGSPCTTPGNSLVNGFGSYVAYRLAGMPPRDAYRNVGPKYGDDGVDLALGKFTEMANALGMTLKITSNGPNCTFLGRMYLDVYHHLTTLTPVPRLLKRLPVSVKSGDTAARDRVAGYMVTDGHVPLVSNYMRALVRIYDLDLAKAGESLDRDLRMKLDNGSYPECKGEHYELLLDSVAVQLDLTVQEVLSICQRLDEAQSVDDLVKIKLVRPDAKNPSFQFYML